MKMMLLVALFSSFALHHAFRPSISNGRLSAPNTMKMASTDSDITASIKKFSKVSLGIVAGFALAAPDFSQYYGAVAPAAAEFRAQQKRTFFRFSPKFIVGRDFYKTELKKAIDSEDWEAIKKFTEVYPSKINRNDASQIDAYDSYVNSNFYRPMKVLAGSFADRGSSKKQRALMEQEVAFETAVSDLEGCIKDRKGEGLFASTIKMPVGEARTKQAKEAYAKGSAALDEYVRILDEGLMLELNKIPL